MNVEERPVKDWLAHLRRHPVPELLDEACMDALSGIEAQYGDTISHGAGLEIRLGDEARYADYIMNIDTDEIPFVQSLWYEIDYEEFLKASQTGERIEPCLFANVDPSKAENEAAFWDAVLPVFLGEGRAVRLRPVLDAVIGKLPEGAHVKQIGTMSGRGAGHHAPRDHVSEMGEHRPQPCRHRMAGGYGSVRRGDGAVEGNEKYRCKF